MGFEEEALAFWSDILVGVEVSECLFKANPSLVKNLGNPRQLTKLVTHILLSLSYKHVFNTLSDAIYGFGGWLNRTLLLSATSIFQMSFIEPLE